MSTHRPLQDIIEGFTSYEEEAAFWDGIDIGEYEEALEPGDVEISPNLGHVLAVRFDRETFRRLSTIAKSQNMNVGALAQMWVFDKLVEAEYASAAQPAPRASAG